MALTQDDRLIAIETPLGSDVLLLRGLTGHEAISRLFSFELDLLSPDPEIKFEQIIGQSVTIRIRLRGDKERFFNGIISRFMQTGSDAGLANYRATMVPKLWLLTRTADCRIFQNKKIPDIIQEVIKENGITDLRTVLTGSYEPQDYCVQYRETDFNFVSRLMEQYGLFYFFEHGEKKHTLVLSDDLSAHKPCPEQDEVSWNPQGGESFDEDVITSLQWEETFRFGKYAVTDYNFETPSTSLKAEVKTKIAVGGNDKFEIFDYPGEYGKKAEGDGIAKLRMEEEEAQYKVISGSGGVRVFTTGYKFTLQDYVRKDINSEYLLTQVQHAASVGNTYEAGSAGGGNQDEYSNSFTCMPAKTPFRAKQTTPKPMVQGPQTAVVVGKSGEEIWTDKYGRVKVQFHWDRYGEKNEESSCWVRVSQNWAGKNWGAMFIPRMGQEVIVEFLEGDPDQPIITGRVYNAEQTVPYGLPGNQTQSGIKSNSSKGGGGSNEWRFEDKKGSEEIYLHGQKDWTILIENDKNQTIGHDETLHVKNDRTKTIDHDENSEIKNNRNKTVGVNQIEDVGSNKTITVGANHTESIGGNKTLSVTGNHTETIGGNETITVSTASAHTIAAARALTIGAAYQVSVGAAMNETVGGLKAEEIGGLKSVNVGGNSSENVGANKSIDAAGNISENAGKSVTITAGENVTVKAGKKMLLDAGDAITIQTGSAKIQMKKNGDIVIEGKKISVKASGDIVMKGQKILQN